MRENTPDDDVRLLARAAAGDEPAFHELFRKHASVCLARAYDVLRDRTLAEDAVQEAFVNLWRAAGAFDRERAAVRTWLLVLVHRRAIDIARREARRRLLDRVPADVEPGSYTSEEMLDLRMQRREIQSALQRVQAPKRELLELAFYGGLTHSQLALRFDVPLGTLKSRMQQALADLAAAVTAAAAAT